MIKYIGINILLNVAIRAGVVAYEFYLAHDPKKHADYVSRQIDFMDSLTEKFVARNLAIAEYLNNGNSFEEDSVASFVARFEANAAKDEEEAK